MLFWIFNSRNTVSKRENGEACCQSIRSNINESVVVRRSDLFYTSIFLRNSNREIVK